ncbi:DUF7742 family protein [Profundibacter amoris]|uniref:DUF7742 family protein n=1 Tax=Profundibacter amoris TaxID=2171755 RepID=UPI001888A2F8|nr:hypothetical protein [Profundibacter amoris]
MRPVLHGDVVAAALVLLRLPVSARTDAMRDMLEQAAAADLYRKRLGKGHPAWGNGSLMAVAMRWDRASEPFLDDPDYCRCLITVFSELLAWRSERAMFSRKRRKCRLARSGQAEAV